MDEQNETTTPQELPSDLTGMTVKQLDEELAKAKTEAKGIDPTDPELTDEQADRLDQLADFVEAVAQRKDAIAQEKAERAAKAQAAAERMAGGDGEPSEGDESGSEGDDSAAAEDGAEDGAETPAPEAVAAGGSRTPAPRPAPRRSPAPAKPKAELTTITAAADLGGKIAGGAELDSDQLAEAFVQAAKGFRGLGTGPGVYSKKSVAIIERHFDRTTDGLWYGNEDFGAKAQDRVQNVLVAAANERRLSGKSLVAAGGWCAPSETLYGIPSDETLDGIIDLPTVGVDRGGINYTPGPDFADIYTTAGFAQTEAEAIAGTTKTCVEVDCPDFSEVRLDAVGFCVKAPLLTRAAYGEAITRWLNGTQVANQHKIAARLISGMRTALGTALAPTLTGTPITWGLLSIIEWVIETQRTAYRLSENETLEVIIPRWVRAAVRADLANRNGMVASERVTNAMIAEHFADRGAAVQWVLNYLETGVTLTSVAYPTTFEVMVYPAGTFVKGMAEVVSLDTIYDTADLQTNVFTAAFVEDGVLLAKMKHGGKRITVPTNVNGMTGSPQLDDNLFTAQVENAGAAAV